MTSGLLQVQRALSQLRGQEEDGTIEKYDQVFSLSCERVFDFRPILW